MIGQVPAEGMPDNAIRNHTDLQEMANAQTSLLQAIEEVIPALDLKGENQLSPHLPEEATHG